MRLPRRLINELHLARSSQAGDQRRGQSAAAHVVERQFIQHEVGMAGAQQIEKVQPGLGGSRGEPGEAVVADLRAKAIFGFMPCAGVIDRYPRRCLQAGAQHVAGLIEEDTLLVDQQPLDLALRDRHAERMQQRRQTGQRGLTLMILHQHETAQVGAEMSCGSFGECCDDGLAVRRDPAFAADSAPHAPKT